MTNPSGPRPFVVVENGNPDARDAQAEILEGSGFEVGTCPGPRGLPDTGCPLLVTGDCELVSHADAVVYDLDLDNGVDREILWLLRSTYPHLPVVLEVPASTAHHHRHLLMGCAVRPPYSPEQLVAAVREAMTRGTTRASFPEEEVARPPLVELAYHGARLVDHLWQRVVRRPHNGQA